MNIMNKLFFVAFFAFLLLPNGFGETLFERSFAEMGYEPFLVEGAIKTGCHEVQFLFPEILTEGKTYAIASIGIEFGPVQEGKIDVNVSINNWQIAGLTIEDFKCGEGLCWERISLPKDRLLEEKNALQVCMRTGNSITRMLLSNRSKVGLYKTADFSAESAFRTYAEKTDLVIGEKTKITILLHNQGSGVSLAEIQYARPIAEDKNAFSVVEGDNYFSGFIEAGEEVQISYVVKPRLAVHMTLPPAIVYYENAFGEQESKFSNLVSLNVREPERKVEAFIVKEDEAAFVGQQIEMQLAVKNIGTDPLYDLSVDLESDAAINQRETWIGSIMPKETRYLPFTVSSLQAGQFQIGCTVTYTDLNVSESHCQDSFVLFEQPGIGLEIYAGIALVAIAVIVYLYIMKTG